MLHYFARRALCASAGWKRSNVSVSTLPPGQRRASATSGAGQPRRVADMVNCSDNDVIGEILVTFATDLFTTGLASRRPSAGSATHFRICISSKLIFARRSAFPICCSFAQRGRSLCNNVIVRLLSGSIGLVGPLVVLRRLFAEYVRYRLLFPIVYWPLRYPTGARQTSTKTVHRSADRSSSAIRVLVTGNHHHCSYRRA